MSFYEWLSKGSEAHKVEPVTDGIAVTPIDGTKDAVERFQRIAQEAIGRQTEREYEIYLAHKTLMLGGDLYDKLVILKSKGDG